MATNVPTGIRHGPTAMPPISNSIIPFQRGSNALSRELLIQNRSTVFFRPTPDLSIMLGLRIGISVPRSTR